MDTELGLQESMLSHFVTLWRVDKYGCKHDAIVRKTVLTSAIVICTTMERELESIDLLMLLLRHILR